MSTFWRTKAGHLRIALLALVALLLSDAVYDLTKEGRVSLTGFSWSFAAIALIALAPIEDEPSAGRMTAMVRSPRYLFGIAAALACLAIMAIRVFRTMSPL